MRPKLFVEPGKVVVAPLQQAAQRCKGKVVRAACRVHQLADLLADLEQPLLSAFLRHGIQRLTCIPNGLVARDTLRSGHSIGTVKHATQGNPENGQTAGLRLDDAGHLLFHNEARGQEVRRDEQHCHTSTCDRIENPLVPRVAGLYFAVFPIVDPIVADIGSHHLAQFVQPLPIHVTVTHKDAIARRGNHSRRGSGHST